MTRSDRPTVSSRYSSVAVSPWLTGLPRVAEAAVRWPTSERGGLQEIPEIRVLALVFQHLLQAGLHRRRTGGFDGCRSRCRGTHRGVGGHQQTLLYPKFQASPTVLGGHAQVSGAGGLVPALMMAGEP